MSLNHDHKLFILLLLTVFLSASCESDFIRDEAGYTYKILRDGTGPAFQNNHFILMNMDYFYGEDSLLYTSAEKGIPVSMQYIDTIWANRGQLYQGLKKLKVGDSAILKVNCADLYEKSFRANVPYGLNPNTDITFYVGIQEMLDPEQFRLWQASLYQSRQKKIREIRENQFLEDIFVIDMHLDREGIVPMELESGARYIVHEPGEGRQPEKGDRVTIHYTGYLLDGTVFDSSADQEEPVEFVLGSGKVLRGWEEAVAEMHEGARYTFYFPSALAFGVRGNGKLVGPNAIAVYDIELLEIVKNKD